MVSKKMSGGVRPQQGEASGVRGLYSRNENTIIKILAVMVFLAAWEVVSRLNLVNPVFISSPSKIFLAGIQVFSSGVIWVHLRVSVYEFAMGFGLSVLVGIALGVATGWYERLNTILDPFISALYATPRVAIISLLIIWFGIGAGSKIAIIFLGSVFPILVNTATGFRMLDPSLVKAARCFGCNDWKIFKDVALPSSVPFVLTGLRLGVGHGLIGIVVGEMYAATAGIGFFIANAGNTFRTDQLFVGVAIIAGAGVLLSEALKHMEKRFDAWRPKVN